MIKKSMVGTIANPREVFLRSCGHYITQGLVMFNLGVDCILKREVVSPGWGLWPSLNQCVCSLQASW